MIFMRNWRVGAGDATKDQEELTKTAGLSLRKCTKLDLYNKRCYKAKLQTCEGQS